jgi:pimeloyl-ACP methyl ester carboxylesterase
MQEVSVTRVGDDVSCRQYLADGERRAPFAVFQHPQTSAPAPVVLVQHGGGGHKLAVEVMDLVERFVVRHRWAVVAMDGPVHGDRRSDRRDDRPHVQGEFLGLWRSGGTHVDETVADWQSVIGALAGVPAIRSADLYWVGVSMGTAYGMPLLAVEKRIRAALLGMWGLSYPRSEVLAEAAERISCPVLFQQKWDDEIFTRDSQIELFDRIAATGKRLNVYPGKHVPVAGEQLDDIERFILSHAADRS